MAQIAQGADVAGRRELCLARRRKYRRHHQRVRDALALDAVQRQIRLEGRQNHMTAAMPHGRQHGKDPSGVEHRRADDPFRVRPERPCGHEVLCAREQAAVAVHRTLRRASRPGGVEQRGDVALVDALAERHLIGPVDQRLVAVRDAHNPLHRATRLVGLTIREHQAGTGVLENRENLRLSEARVDRNQDEPNRRYGKEKRGSVDDRR
jgi:hypothetical protein